MIEGRINHQYEPVVTIAIVNPTGAPRELEAVVDTGFNGFIILTEDLVEELDPPFPESQPGPPGRRPESKCPVASGHP